MTETAYQGHRRMTLTYPALDAARQIVWLVTGAEQAGGAAPSCSPATTRSPPAGSATSRWSSSPTRPRHLADRDRGHHPDGLFLGRRGSAVAAERAS